MAEQNWAFFPVSWMYYIFTSWYFYNKTKQVKMFIGIPLKTILCVLYEVFILKNFKFLENIISVAIYLILIPLFGLVIINYVNIKYIIAFNVIMILIPILKAGSFGDPALDSDPELESDSDSNI